jgi:hypothetical protein
MAMSNVKGMVKRLKIGQSAAKKLDLTIIYLKVEIK